MALAHTTYLAAAAKEVHHRAQSLADPMLSHSSFLLIDIRVDRVAGDSLYPNFVLK